MATTRNPIETVIRNGREYKIWQNPESGLMTVWVDGQRIGSTQTVAGAHLIRRNHSRAAVTLTPWEHEPPTPR